MKYQAPYGSPGGPNDEAAPYINGNPSTGTMGSIPPAASIEYPQREIVNLIKKSGLTPADIDLLQLLKAVRSSAVMYEVDIGIPGVVQTSFDPPLDGYTPGLTLHIKTATACPGPSTYHDGVLPTAPIVNPDGTPLTPFSWPAGAVIEIIYDDVGAAFQLIAVAAASGKLFAPADYYVDAGIGSDTLYDGSSPTISGKHGPFKTIQRALTEAYKFNQNGFNVSIYVALGTYPPFTCTAINGSGGIGIFGDLVTPSNVLIHAVTGEAITVQSPGYFIFGIKVQSDAAGAIPHLSAGFRIGQGTCGVRNIEFGNCADYHVICEGGGSFDFSGADGGDMTAFYNVSGNAQAHLFAAGGTISLHGTILNVIGARTVGQWLSATAGGVIGGHYQFQNLGGGVTGQKYSASLNAVVVALGAGVNYFPGTAAGALFTGAQYG